MVVLEKKVEKLVQDAEGIGGIVVANMPISNVFLFLVGAIVFVFFIVLGSVFAKKPGQAGEENTLRIIKNFIKQKG